MSHVAGRPRVRRMLKRLPDTVPAEIVDEFERAGREIVPVMRSRAPVKTGATQAGISYKVLAKSLQLLIGRYTGYRLTELFRFRDFAEPDAA